MTDKAFEKAQVMQIFDDLVEPTLNEGGDPEGFQWAGDRVEIEQRLNALIASYPPGQVIAHIRDKVSECHEIHYPVVFIGQELSYLEEPKAWSRSDNGGL